jgi:hypothetical protein
MYGVRKTTVYIPQDLKAARAGRGTFERVLGRVPSREPEPHNRFWARSHGRRLAVPFQAFVAVH